MYHRSLGIIFQILRKSTVLKTSSKQCFTISSYKNASNVSNICAQQRLYSVQPTIEEMIVSYDEVKNATSNKGILIVDVREPDEIKEHGKIPNSINIPLGDVTKVLSAMPENEFETTYRRSKPLEDSPIIFYCMIGKRSGMAQQNALNLGFKNVRNYLGSWTDWASKAQ